MTGADTITSLGLGATLAIDHACLPMVMSMMQRGMRVDPQQLTVLSDELQSRMLLAQVRIAELTGKVINPGSPIQVPELLTELGFRLHARTPTGRLKVDERELNRIKHPVIDQILEYRRMQKLDSTYCQALLRQRDAEDRVHTTIKVTRTSSGRFSSAQPNLQNIPTRTTDGKRIRAAFVSSPGRMILSVDYSQVELRVVAHESHCVGMMELFNTHRDLHTETAARIFNLSLDVAADDKYRYPTKRASFGIIYGISAKGLYELFLEEGVEDWTVQMCEQFLADYFKLYPEIPVWQQEQITFAHRNGYVRDMFGRIRWIPELLCPIPAVREVGIRELCNHPVQSGAQGIIKAAMGELWQQYMQWGKREQNRVWWLMQIHDELLIEVDEDIVSAVAVWCKGVMEGAVKLSVPVEVGVKMGRSWGDLKKVQV